MIYSLYILTKYGIINHNEGKAFLVRNIFVAADGGI